MLLISKFIYWILTSKHIILFGLVFTLPILATLLASGQETNHAAGQDVDHRVNSAGKDAFVQTKWIRLLSYNILFYEAQRSGKLPVNI
jgi:hypothetical protein